ncbi:unnamed protein product [Rotaria magnacalcarata]|uniref:Uncharacterized protein n=3 Tax=Rotaria magnacalcarata TaxID=392030 RepID=A0A816QCR1_9BILA|nr:unnamed protein product [Rotaria magnacalcarata]CAF1340390.1 unnamed protein product [Rotaria magnacalcarata]CAF2039618.1 unnamed protein product [Rotaria magnacalcarata]CAF2058827.1 unnamed protein product [Rotaria magnacalcarata]CAF2068992.1 unnamed protein product [Rotaria magnacalcarata]
MTPAPPKFGVRFLTRKERTVRRVTKCETREIKKRLEPSTSPSVPVKKIKTLNAVVRPKPATLVKIREPKKVKPMAEVSSNEKEQVRTATSSSVNRAISATTVKSPISSVRTLQTTDLQRLSRLTCSREFSFFHKEIKCELRTNEHQLAFFQTKLYHLKNEFINQNSEHHNLEQIKNYFAEAHQKNVDRRIKPDEFNTLADKLKQDIKQAIDKWLKKKEPGKQNRALSDYTQKRQSRIRELIKETIEETKKQQDPLQENSDKVEMDNTQDQSQIEEECID